MSAYFDQIRGYAGPHVPKHDLEIPERKRQFEELLRHYHGVLDQIEEDERRAEREQESEKKKKARWRRWYKTKHAPHLMLKAVKAEREKLDREAMCVTDPAYATEIAARRDALRAVERRAKAAIATGDQYVGPGRGNHHRHAERAVVNDQETWFASVKLAARATRQSRDNIYYAVKDPKRMAGGMRWRWADQPRPAEWDDPKRRGPNNQRAVVTSQDEYFQNFKTAAQGIGVSAQYLREAIRNGYKVKGRRANFADSGPGMEILKRIRLCDRSRANLSPSACDQPDLYGTGADSPAAFC